MIGYLFRKSSKQLSIVGNDFDYGQNRNLNSFYRVPREQNYRYINVERKHLVDLIMSLGLPSVGRYRSKRVLGRLLLNGLNKYPYKGYLFDEIYPGKDSQEIVPKNALKSEDQPLDEYKRTLMEKPKSAVSQRTNHFVYQEVILKCIVLERNIANNIYYVIKNTLHFFRNYI